MSNKLFSLTLLLLLILGIGIFVKPQNKISVLEKRGLMDRSDIKIDGDVNEIENILKDQFYFRNTINTSYYRLNNNLARLLKTKVNIDDPLSPNTYTVLNDEISEIDDEYLIFNTLIYNYDNEETIASRGFNVYEFSSKHPEVKTYVYFPTRLEEVIEISYGLNYGTKYRERYIRELGENVSYDYLKINSVDEYKRMYYKSDNHWNAYGAYEAYKDIINMIKKDFDIESPMTYEKEIIYEHKFLGNMASKAGGLGEYDQLIDLSFKDIKEYDYFINGVKSDLNEAKEHYKEYGNDTEFYDYGIYFGDNDFEKIFDFKQEDKPNLLIFGDSFLNTNNSWIASHFNKTIIIDLRNIPEDFNVSEYLKKYDIDAVLVTMAFWDLYYNGYMYIPID